MRIRIDGNQTKFDHMAAAKILRAQALEQLAEAVVWDDDELLSRAARLEALAVKLEGGKS